MTSVDLKILFEQLATIGWQAGVIHAVEPLGGGVHAAHRVRFERGDIFLKTEPAARAVMFDEEAEGLARLREADSVATPRVLSHGVAGETAYLALEWLDLRAADAAAQQRLGRDLAVLHRQQSARHGWPRDNHIGLTVQPNAWSEDWCEFFAEQRLGFQLRLAEQRTGDGWIRRGFKLLDALPRLLAGHRPAASLLHGDLWSGNMAMRADGTPVVFDPAAHYGDRECDLAMTGLFGGFAPEFHSAYEDEWPLPDGHEERRPLYQLYHVVNHVNLFGGGYARQAARMIEALLKRM